MTTQTTAAWSNVTDELAVWANETKILADNGEYASIGVAISETTGALQLYNWNESGTIPSGAIITDIQIYSLAADGLGEDGLPRMQIRLGPNGNWVQDNITPSAIGTQLYLSGNTTTWGVTNAEVVAVCNATNGTEGVQYRITETGSGSNTWKAYYVEMAVTWYTQGADAAFPCII